jgi:DeoR/GlpR family transcriptional regulator of sugar metabolism
MTNKSATASMPADMSVPAGPAGPRRKALHRLISERGFVAVAEIAREIGVSDMTVRRDLDALARDGLAQRSHGGAVLAPPAAVIPTEPSYVARRKLNPEAKGRIASAAAAMVSAGDAIGLDVGSTVAFLAAELARREGIEIVTNSLQAIIAMPQPVLPEVFLLGGRLRPREGSLCGSITRQQLSGHWMDRVFIGAAGIDEHGIYDYSPEDAEVKLVYMERAKSTIVLCDSSKFDRRAFVRICGFGTISTLVTDGPLPPHIERAAIQAGTAVVVANSGPVG